ncbi:response regulator [bacterium]|nr:response regulator [bacterium]MBU1984423.1 response regulator [bacterium]
MSETTSILFVDDEEKVLKALRRHFIDEPYRIHLATSARDGLDLLERIPIDVVVSDYRMPQMNGGEFLRLVSERWPDTMRIVLSGYADITAVITAINEGAIFKFISKPWAETELKDTVREAAERQHDLRQIRQLAETALAASESLFTEERDEREQLNQRNLELESRVSDLELYEAAIAAVATPLLVYDRDGVLRIVNDAASRWIGSSVEGKEGSPESGVFGRLGGAVAHALRAQPTATQTEFVEWGGSCTAEVTAICRDGIPIGAVVHLRRTVGSPKGGSRNESERTL